MEFIKVTHGLFKFTTGDEKVGGPSSTRPIAGLLLLNLGTNRRGGARRPPFGTAFS